MQKPAAIQLCEELGLSGQLMTTRTPRTAFVLRDGRLHPLPSPSVLGIPTSLEALWRYDLLDWPARLRVALEPLVPGSPAEDESVAAFFRRRFGAATVDLIAEPLLGGIHAGDVEQLSMRSVFPRLMAAARQRGGIARNLGGVPRGADTGMFRALRGGMADLVAAIERALPRGAVRTSSAAATIARRGSGWTVTAGADRIDASAVILSSPAHAWPRCCGRSTRGGAAVRRGAVRLDGQRRARLETSRRRASAGRQRLRGGAPAQQRVRITACTWVSSKWEDRAPPDHVLLRAFVGGAHDPGAVDLDDQELIDMAVRELAALLGISAPPMLTRVFRAGTPARSTRSATARASQRWLGGSPPLPGLFVAGSGFESIGIPDCVANGRRIGGAAADYVRMGS